MSEQQQQSKVVNRATFRHYEIIVHHDGAGYWAEVKTDPDGDPVWTSKDYPTEEEAMGDGMQYAQAKEEGKQ